MAGADDNFARVANVVGRIFGVPPSEITPSTAAADIDGWDSVSHAMLTLELEDEFKIRLDFEQTASFKDVGALAEHIRGKAEEQENVQARAAKRDGKPLMILFGNCQAEVLAGHFKTYPPLGKNFDIRYIPNYFKEGVTNDTMPSPEELASCAFLLEQRTPHVRFPEPERVSNAKVVTYASLDFNILWPLHAQEPRNAPRPDLPHGPNGYGDRIINKIVKEGLSGDAGWKAYVEQSEAALSNLPRLLEIEQQRWALMERDISVGMSDFVFGAFRKKRIYSTYNHPIIGIISEMASRILISAGLDGGATPGDVRALMSALFRSPFGEELQAPVHPRIARELELAWWTPDLTYNWHGHRFTYEQFIRRQIDWTV